MSDITILGAGGWGLGIAILLNNNGHKVTMWSALENEIEMLKKDRENKNSLPGIKISEDINLTSNLEQAVKDKDMIIMAVASSYTRQTAAKLKGLVKENQLIVNVAKGVEENTLYTLTEVIKDELPNANVAVLSGPSHAEEVGRGMPTTCVAGADTKETAEYIQNVFMSNCFRVYISSDVLGIELGGALKNVIALAAGIADGLGYGDNTKAALITRGINEIGRLGVAMGGKIDTFAGLTGIGDLIVTCASMHSRNRRAGILIGKGYTMEEAMNEVHMVVEGVYSAKAALALGKKYNVQLPIIEKVNEILFEGLDAGQAVSDLMLRNKTVESLGVLWQT
ncbi:MAG: NAD(P)-dependent glycerol-3-phosphate dehydrogenase [Lachnospiraceae bacterium]|nr:NAD(P)-dependent glycerol-3-phosphate dehydrogenase [Lachnospiraceae bacterium]